MPNRLDINFRFNFSVLFIDVGYGNTKKREDESDNYIDFLRKKQ